MVEYGLGVSLGSLTIGTLLVKDMIYVAERWSMATSTPRREKSNAVSKPIRDVASALDRQTRSHQVPSLFDLPDELVPTTNTFLPTHALDES